MRKIYFENRCIIICRPDDQMIYDPNAIILRIGETSDIPQMIDWFETNPSLAKIVIPSEDIESTYRLICKEFYEVNAAGGLVLNRRSDILLIRRNGLWDLPKGHQDPGEEISTTALREVEEETGIDGLELNELICVTDHYYRRNGIRHLKHTWWYRMTDNKPIELTPQKEEDITKAAWVAKSMVQTYTKDSYASITEVIRHFFHQDCI